MKAYTVLLMRPDVLIEDLCCEAERLYVALVSITPTGDKYMDAKSALDRARCEAFSADAEEATGEFNFKREDYEMLTIFEGHHDALYFGFQAGF